MYRLFWFVVALSVLVPNGSSLAQTASSATTTCNFDPNKQLAVEYQTVTFDTKKKVLGGELSYGKVWAPGGKPMKLFANTPTAIGGVEIPIGAYTMFVIPAEKSWTLILSKSADTSGKYDEKEDLARIPMQYGELPRAEPQFSAYFAHVAADQCNLRLDLQKARSWVVFKQKK